MTAPGRGDGEETAALLERLPGTRRLDLDVLATDMLTPRTRRIRLTGAGLDALDAFPGQDLMVEVPAPGRANFRRRYTMRRLDPTQPSVDLDIVLHGQGPGVHWASALTVGDRVEAIGPRGKIGVAEGADWHLFCGDESAVPAVFCMVEALPDRTRAICLLEVSDASDELASPDARARLELRWLHRNGDPGTGEALAATLVDLELPAGHGHAYVFGELRQVAAARSTLLERGLDPSDVDHKAYWRRGLPNAAHGEPERPKSA
jgi:NADPH-dependent ferric siderophore reductase